MDCHVETNTSKNKFGTGILRMLRFKTVSEIIQCCLSSNGYEGFGHANLRILYDENTLRGGEKYGIYCIKIVGKLIAESEYTYFSVMFEGVLFSNCSPPL